ncbi:MAG: hypothetical protein IKK04_09080 [Bacteroidales bacterium]|nr:hypothetical protein [Bacteroidales bacterium]
MKKTKILCLLIMAVLMCGTAAAQNRKYKSLNDSTVVKYMRGGYVKDGKLLLMASDAYSSLDLNQKKEVLNKIARDFPNLDITVYANGHRREVWIAGASVIPIEQWDNDDLQLENYQPLELKRSGDSKVFYYVGGSFNKGENYSNGSLNLRGGTYLYKNTLDISATLGIGYVGMSDTSHFSGNIGIDSRYYLPYKPKAINLSPYAGAGVAWTFAPSAYFELRMLAGCCWFIGQGSLDFGLQYGIKSGVTFNVGFTFRPKKLF